VVVSRNQPLVFRPWRPGTRLERGVWNIPVPADGPEVVPDVVIAPIVGFDVDRYRLGYGGGYYDRTLATIPTKPSVIGVGYVQAALETIHPQPHDVPMDVIVTERGVVETLNGRGR
jgi:5,10-methenyltetrahydrofolate synthetase